ncbi:D(2) dopamine receptor-like [Actinia tenebrosa]|uniref:D(2) dopamine receptor-like n=1 Tax=Actinia tenebrosa TaxID=6105 RepID=A0A6P8IAW9_ACTTE|nr:D(2) dopamine receptor-like [Actinia tenebrosa]
MEERSLEERIALALILGLIIICGVIGNAFVIIATIKFERIRRTNSNFLLLNLAIADILSSSVIMPYHLATVINLDIVSSNGVVCWIGGAITYPILIASTLTVVMLAADRYIAMMDPLRYKARITSRTIIYMICYTWLHSVFFAVLAASLVKIEFDKVSLDCGVSWDKTPLWFGVISMILNIVAPFIFMACSSLKVLAIARKQHKIIETEAAKRQGGRNAKVRESKATSAILLVILLFLIAWLPYLVTRVIRVFNIILPSTAYTTAIWILHVNAVVNFFIYTRRNQDYRRAFMSMIKPRNSSENSVEPYSCN